MWCLDGPPWACRCDYPPDIALGAAFRDHPGLAPLVRAPLSGTCVGWVTCTGAQQMKHSQLVGFTATTVTKDTDAIRMTNLRQTEVESEARICNSAEVTAAVSVTQSLPARQSAWVRRGSSPNSTAEVSVAIISAASQNILDLRRCSCNALKVRVISESPHPLSAVCRYVPNGRSPLSTDLRLPNTRSHLRNRRSGSLPGIRDPTLNHSKLDSPRRD